MKKLLKEIYNSPFKLPIKKYYFGRLKHGTPYFYPRGFCSTIFKFRKLKLNPPEEVEKQTNKWTKEAKKFANLPMVRRSKDWIVKLFGNYYWIQFGSPIKIHSHDLGWKDKWDSPRFEHSPGFYIFFFHWQFCIWWLSPTKNEDRYWCMFLWWKVYSNKDIKKAEETWGWKDLTTNKSTWDKNNLK